MKKWSNSLSQISRNTKRINREMKKTKNSKRKNKQ